MRTSVVKKAIRYFIILFSLQVFFTEGLRSQVLYRINSDSRVMVEGTSTLHDWESKTTTIEGKARIEVKEGRITGLREVEVKIPVESIQSGKSLMDRKTYDALEAEDHPYIIFSQSDVKSITAENVVLKGIMIIAGVEKQVELQADYEFNGSQILFSGQLPLKMSEYNVDPPTAMMGTIKTGNDVMLKYKGVFSKAR